MTTNVLTDGEQWVNTDTYLSYAGSAPIEAFAPAVDDGAGATVAVDYEVRVETTGGGSIDLKTADGLLIGVLPGRSQAVLVARAGVQESEQDRWNMQLLVNSPAATVADSSGTDAARIDAIRDALVSFGILKAE